MAVLVPRSLISPRFHSEAEDFDSVEDEMDIELSYPKESGVLCESVMRLPRGLSDVTFCIKPADVSRGAGFAASNARACAAASKGAGCSPVGNLFFPNCAAGYHAVGSLCSFNCPLGWSDEFRKCVNKVATHKALFMRG